MRATCFVTMLAAISAIGAPAWVQGAPVPAPYAEQLATDKDNSWWVRELRDFRIFPHRDGYYRLLAKGRWQAAAEELEAILKIAPEADPVRFELLKLHYGHGHLKGVQIWADRLITRRPAFAPAYLYRGMIHYETGRRTQATADLNRARALGGLTAADRRKAENLLARMALEQTFIRVETRLRLLRKAVPDIALNPLPAPPQENGDDELAGIEPPDLPIKKPQQAASNSAETSAKRAAVWRQRGYRAMESGDPERAITAFEAALAIGPETPVLTAQLGYAHLAAGNLDAAEAALTRAAPALAKSGPVYEDIGYIHKRRNRPEAAAQNFRRAIDSYIESGQKAQTRPLKQEVEWIEDRFDAGFYTLWRADSGDTRPSPLERDLQQSQGGVSLDFLPPGAGHDTGVHAKIFGRLLWSYRENTLRPQGKSVQGGIGVKIRPFAAHDMVFSAERLIAVGRAGRDEWMIRTGYSYTTGLSPRFSNDTAGRPAARLYLDGALIDPGTPDLYLSGESRAGWAWQSAASTILWPHAVIAANVQDDRFGDASIVEAGAGMAFHAHFGENRYRQWHNTLELSVQYRRKIAGDSAGGSSLIFLVSLRR